MLHMCSKMSFQVHEMLGEHTLKRWTIPTRQATRNKQVEILFKFTVVLLSGDVVSSTFEQCEVR